MTWKSFIPMYGKKTVRRKVAELEDEAQSLPIVFGMLLGKVIEQLVVFQFVDAAKFGLSALLIAVVYVYRREAKKKAEEVKDEIAE